MINDKIVPLPGGAARSDQKVRGVILDETARAHLFRVIIAMVMTLGLASTDVGLLSSNWNMLLEENPVVGWVMGIVTAILGASLMWAAGGQAIKADTENSPKARWMSRIAIFVWALIGGAMTIIRWVAFDMRQSGAISEGEITIGGGGAATVDHVIAITLLVLYAGPGVMAYLHAYHLSNPIAAAQRATHAAKKALTAEVRHLQGRIEELTLLVARREDEIDQIELTHTNALAAAPALAEECKAWGRVQMHRHLGDPANGGITHRPTWLPAPQIAIPATPFDVALSPEHEAPFDADDDLEDDDDAVSA